jgi:Sulfotransferase family
MLDRHPALAVPDESYFIPTLAARHRGRIEPSRFCADIGRISTLRDWGVGPADVAARLSPGATAAEGIAAIYEAYAAACGKERWGDKTPMYMSRLGLLDRLFPTALYVHVVRDGRDAARSFLEMPAGLVTESWAHPRDVAGFACQWRTEVGDAVALGRRLGPARYHELRYERLAADPEGALRAVAAFAELEFDPAMLAYPGTLDLASKPHQARLAGPPTAGVRNWRTEMPAADVAAFEAVAGDTLAARGYEAADPGPPRAPARARLAAYRARMAAWHAAGAAVARSPLWARRHPLLQ